MSHEETPRRPGGFANHRVLEGDTEVTDEDVMRELIESQRAEIERLRTAVVLIANGGTKYDSAADLIRIARAALKDTKP